MSKRIVVVGGGFAGLWSAASAARLRALKGADLDILLVAPDPFHVIRVRCYEAERDALRVPLDDVLGPVGVRREEARVTAIDPRRRTVAARDAAGAACEIPYDRLILAAGSALAPPPIPGLPEHGFDVDGYAGAARLDAHLRKLGERAPPGGGTAVVIGAGLVGIEIACELPERLRGVVGKPVRVVLLERGPEIGAFMGAGRSAILAALAAAGVEARAAVSVRSADADGLVLGDGERIPAATIVCATGLRASPLAKGLGVALDPLGRVSVDPFLAVEGVEGVYAAGDVARAVADEAGHATVMSCQHARPMGRLAGHNAACELLGCPEQKLAFAAPDYVTVLDLGPWGAVYTGGWDRAVLLAEGVEAKATKRVINRQRIYPPPGRDRDAILAAAAPVIQARPTVAAGQG